MNFETQDLARVFRGYKEKKIKQQQSKSNNNIDIEERVRHSVVVVPLLRYI